MLLLAGAVNEVYTSRSPIIPPRLFKASFTLYRLALTRQQYCILQTRTTAIILVSVLLHAIAFFSGAYYLPLYFQALGSSATGAGVK